MKNLSINSEKNLNDFLKYKFYKKILFLFKYIKINIFD